MTTYGKEDMAPDDEREGDDQRPVPPRDLPFEWDGVGGEDDHHGDAGEADDEREPKSFPDAGHWQMMLIGGWVRGFGCGYLQSRTSTSRLL